VCVCVRERERERERFRLIGHSLQNSDELRSESLMCHVGVACRAQYNDSSRRCTVAPSKGRKRVATDTSHRLIIKEQRSSCTEIN